MADFIYSNQLDECYDSIVGNRWGAKYGKYTVGQLRALA